MKHLKKIISRQLKILLLIPTSVVIVTLIYSLVIEKKTTKEKSIEAKFQWELTQVDTRGIELQGEYIKSKISIVKPNTLENYIITNIDAFINEANENNCNITYDEWLKARFRIKVSESRNIFTLELNEFDSSKVLVCRDFVHDYLVRYISKKIQKFIEVDEKEITLLRKSMDNYKNRLNSTLENFRTIFSENNAVQEKFLQERYFDQYVGYLSNIESEILNISARISKLKNVSKKLNVHYSSIKESKKNKDIPFRVLIALIFSLILSILYIAVIESKAIGRYFR